MADLKKTILRLIKNKDRIKNPAEGEIDIISHLILPPSNSLFKAINRIIFIPIILRKIKKQILKIQL